MTTYQWQGAPRVDTNEIDESFIPDELPEMGPIIIGRTRKGPAGIPVNIEGLDNFNSIFGKPVDGASGNDVWRDGIVGPTYASYAAHAWLAAETSPVNIVRCLGEESPSATGTERKPGWNAGAAYGLFVFQTTDNTTPLATTTTQQGALAAIFYTKDATAAVTLSGSIIDESGGNNAATSTITVDDGTVQLSTSGIAEGDTITLNATDGTAFIFMVVDRAAGSSTSATGTAAIEGASEGGLTISSGQAGNIILNLDLGNGGDNQFSILYQLDAAITAVASAKLTPSALPGAAATGNQSLTVTQVVSGFGGNKTNAKTGLSCTAVGNFVGGNEITSTGLGEVIKPNAGSGGIEYTAQIQSDVLLGTSVKEITFNFNRNSPNYIRNVFNTNPTLTNNSITPSGEREIYWLGETFERHLSNIVTDNSEAKNVACILPLVDNTNAKKWSENNTTFKYARSGWFYSQDFGVNTNYTYETGPEMLFRCVALGGGEADNTAFKIAISNLKTPTNTNVNKYGSFTLQVVEVGTNSVLETFSELNFNPDSPNWIVRRIGDQYQEWKETAGEGKYELYGEEPNRSDFIRIEMFNSTKKVSNLSALPFGFLGPLRPKKGTNQITSGSAGSKDWVGDLTVATYGSGSQGSLYINHGSPSHFTASLNFPALSLRISGSDGLIARPARAYFGVQETITAGSRQYDADYCDYLRPLYADGAGPNYTSTSLVASTDTEWEYSFTFSLDDIRLAANTADGWYYEAGSRANSNSYTHTNSLSELLDAGVKQFYAPMHGGFDGLDITEAEPFGNHLMSSTSTKENNAVYYTLTKALQATEDPEVVPANLLLMPGIRDKLVTDKIVSAAEDRKDVLAIIDLEKDYTPIEERTSVTPTDSERGMVSEAISDITNRPNIDSSYGCAFYPAIQIVDRDSGKNVWVPSSVAGLGAMAQSQKASELWFAPAGFNRGGLGALGGRRGPIAVQARQRLDSSQRDDLYDVNINPIASFPNEGLVIFGQKTLQTSRSALDRINVRRLMIHLKKKISDIAKLELFNNNSSALRAKLKNQIERVLSSVKARFGLTGYSVVIDETNNNADVIDNNRLNVSIYVKPARAIEYIAIDFIITRSGVEFAQ